MCEVFVLVARALKARFTVETGHGESQTPQLRCWEDGSGLRSFKMLNGTFRLRANCSTKIYPTKISQGLISRGGYVVRLSPLKNNRLTRVWATKLPVGHAQFCELKLASRQLTLKLPRPLRDVDSRCLTFHSGEHGSGLSGFKAF